MASPFLSPPNLGFCHLHHHAYPRIKQYDATSKLTWNALIFLDFICSFSAEVHSPCRFPFPNFPPSFPQHSFFTVSDNRPEWAQFMDRENESAISSRDRIRACVNCKQYWTLHSAPTLLLRLFP
jgi:hypothetical protein